MRKKLGITPQQTKIALITAAVVIIVYIFGFSWHQSINASREKVSLLGAVLHENVVAQADVLGKLTQLGTAEIPQLQSILQEMDGILQVALAANAVETPWEQPDTMTAFCASEQTVAKALLVLQHQLQAFPQLSQSKEYAMLQDQIQSLRAQIAFSKQALIQEVERYEIILDDFPGRWYNAVIFHYQPLSSCAIPAQTL